MGARGGFGRGVAERERARGVRARQRAVRVRSEQAEGVVIWAWGGESREEEKRLLRAKGDEQKQQIKKGDSFL